MPWSTRVTSCCAGRAGCLRRLRPGRRGSATAMSARTLAGKPRSRALKLLYIWPASRISPTRLVAAVDAFSRVNAEGTARLASAAVGAGIRRLVLVSSALVHGEAGPPVLGGRPTGADKPLRALEARLGAALDCGGARQRVAMGHHASTDGVRRAGAGQLSPPGRPRAQGLAVAARLSDCPAHLHWHRQPGRRCRALRGARAPPIRSSSWAIA